jgi:hypothetical protein
MRTTDNRTQQCHSDSADRGTRPPQRDRYKRPVRRITTEAFWLFTEQIALVALSNVKSVWDLIFFVSPTPLFWEIA